MSSKIEVSRELLSHATALLSSVHSDVAHQLTALLAAPVIETVNGHHPSCQAVDDYRPGECSHGCAPVVERQPAALPNKMVPSGYDSEGSNGLRQGWNDFHDAMSKLGPLYTAPPELAELQAKEPDPTSWPSLKSAYDEAQATIARLTAENERLKGGQGKPFMYGIEQPDGKPHYSEMCVSGEASDLESEVESMNEDGDGGYRVVALYTSQPAPVAVLITLQQVLKAYSYAESHPHKYLRGTTNWCAAVAHELNACLDKVKEMNQ